MSDCLLALDPGTEFTAFMEWDGCRPGHFGFVENSEILPLIGSKPYAQIACEMIASYGMPVGAEVFETCVWIGEFKHAARLSAVPFRKIFRKDVKLHLCMSMRAKDPHVRQALLDRFGPQGTKKAPGPTYGVSKHAWAAMAVAAYAWDTRRLLALLPEKECPHDVGHELNGVGMWICLGCRADITPENV